jgi:hypothetical protein
MMRILPQRSRRRSWLAITVSIAVHSLLVFVVIEGRPPDMPRSRLLFLQPPEPDQERVHPLPYSAPRPFIGRGVAISPRPPENPVPEVRTEPPPAVVDQPEPDTAVARAPVGWLGPDLGDGRLWVRPLPLPPRELAKRLTKTNAELVDSAVHEIIQKFLDSVSVEPGAQSAKMPDWTTKVDGAKFGIDSKNVYIAGLKIPAAILALLPIPASGNQQDAFKRSDQIYRDLYQAAQRATTLDEFKQAIRELRKQQQEKKDFQRAQRETPDSLAVQETDDKSGQP